MNTLLLIDGNAIIHRAYHALPPFTTKNGFPTNAIYGFLSILHKTIKDYQPQYIIVCFDTAAPTFRKKIFKDYQSQRPKIEDNLLSQFPPIKEGLEKAGIIYLEKEGYEADDIIGTISQQFSQKNNRVLILSGDKDIMQLIDKNILIIVPQLGFAKEKIYDENEVKKRFGIKPQQIPDFKALAGDSSDNYKGAQGIGPKTAAKLLNQYHSIDNIFQHIDKIEKKLKTILEKNKENIFLAKKLATIVKDIEINFNQEETKFTGYKEQLKEFLQKYEMYSLLKRMFETEKKDFEKIKKENKKDEKNKNQMKLFETSSKF